MISPVFVLVCLIGYDLRQGCLKTQAIFRQISLIA
jgi:hypothetical protein